MIRPRASMRSVRSCSRDCSLPTADLSLHSSPPSRDLGTVGPRTSYWFLNRPIRLSRLCWIEQWRSLRTRRRSRHSREARSVRSCGAGQVATVVPPGALHPRSIGATRTHRRNVRVGVHLVGVRWHARWRAPRRAGRRRERVWSRDRHPRLAYAYPDGAAPYYTVVAVGEPGREADQWAAIKRAASDAIEANGGTTTHHHAIGRTHLPWYQHERGSLFLEAIASAKHVLDPVGIMIQASCCPGHQEAADEASPRRTDTSQARRLPDRPSAGIPTAASRTARTQFLENASHAASASRRDGDRREGVDELAAERFSRGQVSASIAPPALLRAADSMLVAP